ncbi:MAG: hypothetical protein Q9187_004325, partial [Circinaria calcarea]
MTRYTIALRGDPSSAAATMAIEEKMVDLHRDENLAEQYLLAVNPKGQVPTLTSPALPIPLTESLDITDLICQSYPKLLPPTHRPIIERLLADLHAIQPLSLSIPPPEDRAAGIPNPSIEKSLARPDISDAWRDALSHAQTLLHALDEEPVRRAEEQATCFFESLRRQYSLHRKDARAPWIFGDAVGATALDAHTVPFVARLIDAGRTDLVPED